MGTDGENCEISIHTNNLGEIDAFYINNNLYYDIDTSEYLVTDIAMTGPDNPYFTYVK